MTKKKVHFTIETVRTFPSVTLPVRRAKLGNNVIAFPDVTVPVIGEGDSSITTLSNRGQLSHHLHRVKDVEEFLRYDNPSDEDLLMLSSDPFLSREMGVEGQLLMDRTPYTRPHLHGNGEIIYPQDQNHRTLLIRQLDGDLMEVTVLVAAPTRPQRYVIVSGHGVEAEFGGYSSPYYSDPVVDDHGRTVWTDNPADAYLAVDTLNKKYEEEFDYETGDDSFPMEFKVVQVAEPAPEPASDADTIVSKIVKTLTTDQDEIGIDNIYVHHTLRRENTVIDDIDEHGHLGKITRKINQDKDDYISARGRSSTRNRQDIVFFDGEIVQSEFHDHSPLMGDVTGPVDVTVPGWFTATVAHYGEVTFRWDFRSRHDGNVIESRSILFEVSNSEVADSLAVSLFHPVEGMEKVTASAFAVAAFLEKREDIFLVLEDMGIDPWSILP